jgi:hypothetical protein
MNKGNMNEAEILAAETDLKNLCSGMMKQLGLSFEQASRVVGIIAEQRQLAYLSGYKIGFEHGHKKCEEKKILKMAIG